jgi:hypothetical protein
VHRPVWIEIKHNCGDLAGENREFPHDLQAGCLSARGRQRQFFRIQGGNRVIQKPDVVGRRIVPDVRVKDQSNLVVGPGRDQGFPQDLLLIGQIKDIDAQ